MKLIFFLATFCLCTIAISQNKHTNYTSVDSTNFKKLNPYALRGEMDAVFEMLELADDNKLTEKQQKKKKGYYKRFLHRTENFEYHTSDPEIIDMFKRFQNYWRSIIIEKVDQKIADSLFRNEMNHFLKMHYKPEYSIEQIDEAYYGLFQSYFKSKSLHGIAMAKTGHLYDLYLWKNEKEKVYDIDLPEGQSINVPVVFMRNFISNGWSYYTTFGHSFSGGWATPNKLFCVEESYGPKDEEEFLISYVSHEGQHFSDYKIFPKLKQPDLEYRAKLTELALAETTTHDIIDKFIGNSKNDTTYAHSFANYMVIYHLSKAIFKSDFESDKKKWKTVSVKKINKIALKVLRENTKKLKSLGANTVEAYITTLK